MAACRAELTLTPEKMLVWTIWVAECDRQLAGMAAMAVSSDVAELEEFMVEPQFQGRGLGAALMSAVVSECRSPGVKSIGLDTDPHAEPVYRKLGFSTVGQSPSGPIP